MLIILTGYLGRTWGCSPSVSSINVHRPSPSFTSNHTQQRMEEAERSESGERQSPPLQIDPKWYAHPLPRPDCCPLTGRSFRDALAHFFQPTKTGDPRLDFYTMYKREAAEYDTDYVKKYDEDLNTTLIFVRYLSSYLVNYLTCFPRPACSLRSAPPSSSTSIRISNPIPTNNPPPSSEPSSSLSTNPPFPARPPPFRLFRKAQRTRSSPRPA